jgi:hypothetical protein
MNGVEPQGYLICAVRGCESLIHDGASIEAIETKGQSQTQIKLRADPFWDAIMGTSNRLLMRKLVQFPDHQ